MAVFFTLLSTIIGGYLFITDANRVRQMAESYLTTLLGGPVKVGDARLSIFEGLRLDNVRLYAAGAQGPDSELFDADSFIISYSPAALLSGRIDATRIIAVEPKLYLTENMQTGDWSHQRLGPRSIGQNNSGGMRLTRLPEIVLRNATVAYQQLDHGKVTSRGAIDIEGQLTPAGDGQKYTFQLQSRGRRQHMGPVVVGEMDLATRHVTASMRNFEFGDDLKAMLPSPVRKWWEQHRLAGSLDVNELTFIPAQKPGQEPGFKAEIALQGVMLTVQPEEWMGADEHRRADVLHDSLEMMRTCGLNGNGMIDRFSTLMEPTPIKLHDVFATFVFTDQGIEIRNFTGKLEDISFKIGGKIDGYSPSSAWDLNVASLETRNVEIPESPRYVTSMPPAVREVYDHFRPHGEASFWVRVNRPVPGERLRITGEINIIDGSFTFDKFPYPVRNATGRIALLYDDRTGYDGLELQRIRGQGAAGGPNENSWVEINGTMGPFRSDIGIDVIVTGQNISSEPSLIAAFPEATRTALRAFDAPGKGELPRFSGDFGCSIKRLPQVESHWIIKTDIFLQDAAGELVNFPYPLSGVKGKLEIFDDHVDIIDAHTSKADASIKIDGRVSWTHDEQKSHAHAAASTQPTLRPDLKIAARNVPIDQDLVQALPPDRREWIQKIGLGGKLDIDGTIRAGMREEQRQELADGSDGVPSASSKGGDLDFDLHLLLKDGTMWPADGGAFAVSDVQGDMRLTPQRLTISQLTGKRGDADVTASGGVSWLAPRLPAQMVLQVDAKNLLLDSMLYSLLPDSAKHGWDQVHPEGTIDASFSYSGEVGAPERPRSVADDLSSTTAPSAPATASTSPARAFELTIVPRALSVTPAAVPYKLDNVSGTVRVIPNQVILKDITARHGDAKLALAGTGETAPGGAWDFALSAQSLPVDEALLKAVPKALADLFKTMQLQGKIDFDCSKLHVAGGEPSATPGTTSVADALILILKSRSRHPAPP